MRKREFFTGEMYHLYNRGAGKRPIYYDDADRYRFIKCLMILNSQTPLPSGKARLEMWDKPIVAEDPLVKIVAYTLMPNHYHLVLEQMVEGGIAKFMQRLGTAFTKYLGMRHGHSGVIFSGCFKAIAVDTEPYFLHITRYVHLNPVAHLKARDSNNIIGILRDYKWSSYRHYLGLEKNVLIQNQKVMSCFNGADDYEKFVISKVADDIELATAIFIDE